MACRPRSTTFMRQAEALAVRHARHIAQHHQRVEHAERGAGSRLAARATSLKVISVRSALKDFEDPQSLGQRVDEIARVFGGLSVSADLRTRGSASGAAAAGRGRFPFDGVRVRLKRDASYPMAQNPFFGLRKYFCKTEGACSCPAASTGTTRRTGMLGVRAHRRRARSVFAAAGFALDCAPSTGSSTTGQSGMMIDVFNHFMPQAYLERLGTLIPGHPVLTAFPRLKTLVGRRCAPRAARRVSRHAARAVARQPAAGADRPAGQDAGAGADGERSAGRDLPPASRSFPDLYRLAADEQSRRVGGRGQTARSRSSARAACRSSPMSRASRCRRRNSARCSPRMAAHDLPVWVHPMRTAQFSDYADEKESQNEIWFSFGWPYETTACMTRLIYSGIFDELPTLKIISHHMGGMIPYFAGKIKLGFQQISSASRATIRRRCRRGLKKPPLDYYKMLYADTALGEVGPTRCGHDFFGTAHCFVRDRRAVRFRSRPRAHSQHHRGGECAGDSAVREGRDLLRQCQETPEALGGN